MRKVNCVRCNVAMVFKRREKFQLGEHGFFLGDFSHLVSGALETDIYVCPVCKKMELFEPLDENAAYANIPILICKACGKEFETHLRECPHCGHSRF